MGVCKVNAGVFAVAVVVVVMYAIMLPMACAQSPARAQSPAPAPAPTSDGTSVDQGIAYVLMLIALILTYLIH